MKSSFALWKISWSNCAQRFNGGTRSTSGACFYARLVSLVMETPIPSMTAGDSIAVSRLCSQLQCSEAPLDNDALITFIRCVSDDALADIGRRQLITAVTSLSSKCSAPTAMSIQERCKHCLVALLQRSDIITTQTKQVQRALQQLSSLIQATIVSERKRTINLFQIQRTRRID